MLSQCAVEVLPLGHHPRQGSQCAMAALHVSAAYMSESSADCTTIGSLGLDLVDTSTARMMVGHTHQAVLHSLAMSTEAATSTVAAMSTAVNSQADNFMVKSIEAVARNTCLLNMN